MAMMGRDKARSLGSYHGSAHAKHGQKWLDAPMPCVYITAARSLSIAALALVLSSFLLGKIEEDAG